MNTPQDAGNNRALYELCDAAFKRILRRSPMQQTALGIKDRYSEWDDLSDEAVQLSADEAHRDLTALASIDVKGLTQDAKITYRLFEYLARSTIKRAQFYHLTYPLNQYIGWQSEIPAFLINLHAIGGIDDAEAYVERIRNVESVIHTLCRMIVGRAERGICAPEFVFPYVIQDCRNILAGAPLQQTGSDSPIFADFKSKISRLDILDSAKTLLIQKAERALVDNFGPAYVRLIDCVAEVSKQANGDNGVWNFQEGEAYYQHALAAANTTSLHPLAIHEMGLEEVERITAEIKGIVTKIGFDGDIKEFFVSLRTKDEFYFPDTEVGREKYLERVRTIVAQMQSALPRLFKSTPMARLEVKRVESFRESSVGTAFYQPPSKPGNSPGIYYVNLHNMRIMPTFELEALAYHEAVPGHHLQLGLAVELDNVPEFQKHLSVPAFSEGWALYAETLAKEVGFYEDPYAEFGQLSMELWRACRLVVDTGLHYKRWTREQSIQYLVATTSKAEAEAIRGVERYLVDPGQATAYTVGLKEFQRLRKEMEARQGSAFDLRHYHELVLRSGALPLPLLSDHLRASDADAPAAK